MVEIITAKETKERVTKGEMAPQVQGGIFGTLTFPFGRAAQANEGLAGLTQPTQNPVQNIQQKAIDMAANNTIISGMQPSAAQQLIQDKAQNNLLALFGGALAGAVAAGPGIGTQTGAALGGAQGVNVLFKQAAIDAKELAAQAKAGVAKSIIRRVTDMSGLGQEFVQKIDTLTPEEAKRSVNVLVTNPNFKALSAWERSLITDRLSKKAFGGPLDKLLAAAAEKEE